MYCMIRICVGLLIAFCLTSPRLAAQNLVVNGDFESGGLSPWQWFGTGTNVATLSSDTPSGTGTSADLDINEVVGLPWLIQDVPVTGGNEFTFSASVREVEPFRPDVDAWIAAQIYMLSSPESGNILASGFYLFTNPSWETAGFVITAPPTATIARILFTPQDPDFGVGTGQYRIDDVSLVDNSSDLPGDFNDDGMVDGLDLADWRAGFGTGTMREEGDADDDGDVDGDDFLIWQRNVGAGQSVPAASAVPEPAGAVLLVIAAAALGRCRQRR